MTDLNEKIEGWKELCGVISQGPWEAEKGYRLGGPKSFVSNIDGLLFTSMLPEHANSEFVATSREAVPALIAEVERLQAKIADLEETIEVLQDGAHDASFY